MKFLNKKMDTESITLDTMNGKVFDNLFLHFK